MKSTKENAHTKLYEGKHRALKRNLFIYFLNVLGCASS